MWRRRLFKFCKLFFFFFVIWRLVKIEMWWRAKWHFIIRSRIFVFIFSVQFRKFYDEGANGLFWFYPHCICVICAAVRMGLFFVFAQSDDIWNTKHTSLVDIQADLSVLFLFGAPWNGMLKPLRGLSSFLLFVSLCFFLFVFSFSFNSTTSKKEL